MNPNTLNNEGILLELLANGSEEAYTTVYRHYSWHVYEAAMVYMKEPGLAREIVQEVFLKVWIKRAQFNKVECLKDYLFILSRNCIFDHFRKKAVAIAAQAQLLQRQPLMVNDTDYRVQEQQYSQLLYDAVAAMPPQRRRIYMLAKEEGLSYAQIATRMHISRFTVKNQMAQALQFIRIYIDRHYNLLLPLAAIECFFCR
ncbi:RNA polymerase sigma factor [Chitinophaga agrisoli]|uniref:RNA polymerase sigma factor n=1 Tax=Chitinophaga agrisoli TaxID=2607653 RepID=UPI001662085C|nr:sigma-70 family RNA polymerase sigma factor [Chitinophaga agrisoli]